MNPFDLRGPEFLAFYLALIVAVTLVLRLWRWAVESRGAPPDLTDPYLMAYLRGGQAEAVRVGIVSLIDRGLLRQTLTEGNVEVADPSALERVRRPFEQALLQVFLQPTQASKVLQRGSNGNLDRVSDELKAELQGMGLISGGAHEPTVLVPTVVGLVVLLAVALTKIQVALARGRHNIGFLIILTIVGAIVTLSTASLHRTALGTAALVALKRRFRGLHARAGALTPGGQTNEVMLVAALFGLGALPALSFPYTRQIFPRVSTGPSTTGGCGGSGCAGSVSSSCGGGGGGSGGGGCGGCGGCGG